MPNEQVAEATQEQIVPADTTDSGDWGDDTLSLEQDILDKLNTPEEGAPVKQAGNLESAPTKEPVKAETAAQPDAPVFDINGKLSVKAGQPLTEDHVKQLERGWLRERDYTQKTQQLSQQTQQVGELKKAAEGVLQVQERIKADPKALREFFTPEHIAGSFSKEEMLNYGLSAAGVPPQVWNQFLQWHKEAGLQTAPVPEANPYQNQFSGLTQDIGRLNKTVEQLMTEKQQQVEAQKVAEAKAAEEK